MLGWLHLDATPATSSRTARFQGELAQAVDIALRAVAIEPKNVVALQAFPRSNITLATSTKSKRTQRQALALNPNDPIRWRSL